MNARLIAVLMLLAPAMASAADKTPTRTGAFLPVGWRYGEHYANKAPPNQKAKPKEKWDDPVDKTPDWSQGPDWEQKEAQPKTTSVPL